MEYLASSWLDLLGRLDFPGQYYLPLLNVRVSDVQRPPALHLALTVMT